MFVTALILSDKVGDIILNTVNAKMPTKIEAQSSRLSFIRKFPHASLEYKNITVFSTQSFDKKDFKSVNTDTLLHASSVSMEFSIIDLINKKYDISSVGVKKGKLFIFIDSSGANNYSVAKSEDSPESENNFILNLDKIMLTDVEVVYNDLAISIFMDSWIEKGRLTSKISRGNILFNAETNLILSHYTHKNFTLNNPLSVGVDVNLDNSGNGLDIKKGKLFIEGIRFGLTGSISSEKEMNLKISGEKINLQTIRKYLPPNYAQKLKDYNLKGILTVESAITGKISKAENPHFELNYLLENGSVYRNSTKLNADKIHLKGSFSNGRMNNKNSSVLTINELKANVGSGNVNAKLKVNDLNKPFANIELQGRLYPGEIKQYFDIAKMPYMSGYCDINLNFNSALPKNDNMLATNLLKLKPIGTLILNNINIWKTDNVQILSKVNGEIDFSEYLTTKNFQFEYKNQKATINGKFEKLPE